MQTFLSYALYISMAVVFVILVLGIVNLFSNSDEQRSRSNKLMRLRVAAQFVAILLLVAVGWASGMIGG
ncbi:MAG: twin transmembrane helix small protein [Pseudomonadota bacterium]